MEECTGDPKGPVEGLELRVESHVSSYQGWCWKLEPLHWKPEDSIPGEGEDWGFYEETEAILPSSSSLHYGDSQP